MRLEKFRRFLKPVLIGIGLFTLLEISLFGYVKANRATYLFREDLLPGVTSRFSGVFDAELGWMNHYETPYGERTRPQDFGRPYLAAFGDSYVESAEVPDNETWEEHLARKVKADVFNFGVGGYGPDQALIRYRRMIDKVAPRIAALGFITENINRLENVYRPFYLVNSGIPLTKPRFVRNQGVLEFIPNPISSMKEFMELGPQDLPRLAANDFWAPELRKFPSFSFPYSKLLFSLPLPRHKAPTNEFEKAYANRRPLWWRPETVNLMYSILETFADESRRRDVVPLWMLLPSRPAVIGKLRGDINLEQASFSYFCSKHPETLCLDTVDCVAAYADEHRVVPESLYQGGGHLGPVANARIAECLHALLASRNLLPPPQHTADLRH